MIEEENDRLWLIVQWACMGLMLMLAATSHQWVAFGLFAVIAVANIFLTVRRG